MEMLSSSDFQLPSDNFNLMFELTTMVFAYTSSRSARNIAAVSCSDASISLAPRGHHRPDLSLVLICVAAQFSLELPTMRCSFPTRSVPKSRRRVYCNSVVTLGFLPAKCCCSLRWHLRRVPSWYLSTCTMEAAWNQASCCESCNNVARIAATTTTVGQPQCSFLETIRSKKRSW